MVWAVKFARKLERCAATLVEQRKKSVAERIIHVVIRIMALF
jgi:hypothetical protein